MVTSMGFVAFYFILIIIIFSHLFWASFFFILFFQLKFQIVYLDYFSVLNAGLCCCNRSLWGILHAAQEVYISAVISLKIFSSFLSEFFSVGWLLGEHVVYFLRFFPLLIPTFIPLQSETILCLIFISLNILTHFCGLTYNLYWKQLCVHYWGCKFCC